MADVNKTLEELERRLKEDERKEAELEKGLDEEGRLVDRTPPRIDHARDGGVIG
jgi:hypothetical protein